VWCTLGDFNVVSSREVRRGVNVEDTPDQNIKKESF